MRCAYIGGCQKLVDPGRKYCSRDHAPFGRLVDPQPKAAARSKSLYKRKAAPKPDPLRCEHGKYFKGDCAECKVIHLEKECARLQAAFIRVSLELEASKLSRG